MNARTGPLHTRDAPSRRSVVPEDAGAVEFGATPVAIEAIVAVAHGQKRAVVDASAEHRQKMSAAVEELSRRIADGETIYGVSTGFGESCTQRIPQEALSELPLNLVRFHGCGTGALFSDVEASSIVAARIASLSRGFSAVRVGVVEALCALLNRGVIPCVPQEGSVGASGDLTPLSYVAATLIGEREARFCGRTMASAAALAEAGLSPVPLDIKESLAIMNGTSAMTGLACLSYYRAAKLVRFASALSAGLCDVLRGNRNHFHEKIFTLKPHPGQMLAAAWIRDDIEYDPNEGAHAGRVQDRYSLRCAPHVIGVLADALSSARQSIEIELNSVNDNPIVDPELGILLHGGNFYGGHICHAMDSIKAAVASVADLMDRQMVMLCNPTTNNHLPADLVAGTGSARALHHGFKAMQIATSALAAEALKLTMPAAVFSRSTESHNQDKVSMGTIAARDCLRILQLSEQIATILLLAECQAMDLRELEGCHERSLTLHDCVRKIVAFNKEDRRQDVDVAAVLLRYRTGQLPVGDCEPLVFDDGCDSSGRFQDESR